MELDVLGYKRKMCRVEKRVKTKISGGWRFFCLLSVALWEWPDTALGRVWAAGCMKRKIHILWAWGVFQMLMTCPDLAQSREIWLVVPQSSGHAGLMWMGLYHGPQTASSSALSYVPRLSHPFISVTEFRDQFQDKHLVGEVSILR